MPRADYRICKDCGRHASVVGDLSHTRLCVVCSEARRAQNAIGLATKTGPEFRHWRRQTAAAVGAVLLDELQGRT